MFSDFELSAFILIDNFLQKLASEGDCFPSQIDNNVNSPELQYAYKIMIDERLIHFKRGFPDFNSAVTISSNGLNVLKTGTCKEYFENKQMSENLRLRRKDSLEEIDLKIKRWTYKAKYLPFIFSGLAFIGTVISIIISIKALRQKSIPQDLQGVQEKIRLLQERVDRQDSLFLLDNHLKKDSK